MLYKQALCVDTVVMDEAQLNATASISPMSVHKPNPECVYLRTCAIGCSEVDGANANGDSFPYSEFLNERPNYGFKSFIGKKAFVEHNSSSVSNAIGDLIDSYLRKFDMGNLSAKAWDDLNDVERLTVIGSHLNDGNGLEIKRAYGIKNEPVQNGTGSIEVLMKIDRKRAPTIARQVDLGEKIGVSMGTSIEFSRCSVCNNKAYFEKDYCTHIANGKLRHHAVSGHEMQNRLKEGSLKPEWLRHLVSSPSEIKTILTGEKRSVYVRAVELNAGLSFYELSVVGNPAYNKGYALEKVASTENDWLACMSNTELLELYKEIVFN